MRKEIRQAIDVAFRFGDVEMLEGKIEKLAIHVVKTMGETLHLSPMTMMRLKKIKLKFDAKRNAFSKFTNSSPAVSQEFGPTHAEQCGLMRNLVSIVLPVYNQSDLISDSIDSVLAQTYENFELIIINDGSSDAIEEVLKKYKCHPKIRIYNQGNQGLPQALSSGFSYARGEFWSWTSADNIMEPTMIESLARKLCENVSIGMVYSDYYVIDDRGDILQDPAWRAHNRPKPGTGEVRLPRSTQTLNTVMDNFVGPCFMYRGWIGKLVGDYSPQKGIEDYDYWMRINSFFKIEHLGTDDCLYRYRVHDNTLSAHAQEHRIAEQAHQLMLDEKKREAFYRTPIIYGVDDFSYEWLSARGVSGEYLRRLPNNLENSSTGVDVVVVQDQFAARSACAIQKWDGPLVVVAESDNYLPLYFLPTNRAMVLCTTAQMFSRARMMTGSLVMDARSDDIVGAISAFVKLRQWMLFSFDSNQLMRTPALLDLAPVSKTVLLQTDNFVQGGLENVMIDLAISLKRAGLSVAIAVFGKEGDAAIKAREQGVDLVSLGGGVTNKEYEKLLRRMNVGVVNAHFSTVGASVCSSLGIPFIQTIHNSYIWLGPKEIDAYQKADLYTTKYICVSATAARYADVGLNLDVSKMSIVPNGISPGTVKPKDFESNRLRLRAAWNVDEQTTVFLNVASITNAKAQIHLVEAFGRLLRQTPNSKLVILGAAAMDDYAREVQRVIEYNGISKQVLCAGYDRDVAAYYQAADVFVLPSFVEGWSLSLAEAILNGLPCAITDVGSAYEFYGSDRVEIIQTPFPDIVHEDWTTFSTILYKNDSCFERAIASAMIRSAQKPRMGPSEEFVRRCDRELAYRAYAEMFVGSIVAQTDFFGSMQCQWLMH